MESFEHARRRVFKGVVGRKHTSLFELAARGARRGRWADRDYTRGRATRQAQQADLGSGSLAKLCDPNQIAKRRKRRNIEIRSELADTPLGRKVAA